MTLLDVKKSASLELMKIDGVRGVGLGDKVIRVYVKDEEVIKKLPKTFKNVPLTFVVVGTIMPFLS